MSDVTKPKHMEIPPWDGKTEVSVIIPFCNEDAKVANLIDYLVSENRKLRKEIKELKMLINQLETRRHGVMSGFIEE